MSNVPAVPSPRQINDCCLYGILMMNGKSLGKPVMDDCEGSLELKDSLARVQQVGCAVWATGNLSLLIRFFYFCLIPLPQNALKINQLLQWILVVRVNQTKGSNSSYYERRMLGLLTGDQTTTLTQYVHMTHMMRHALHCRFVTGCIMGELLFDLFHSLLCPGILNRHRKQQSR